MSRNLPAPVFEAAHAQETGEVFLQLITITSAQLAAPIRLVDNTVQIVSRGDVHDPAPFRINLPDDLDGEIRQVQLIVDGIDRQAILAIRSAVDTIQVLLETIVASDPDTVLASASFDVLASSYTAHRASFSLGFEPILFEPFPGPRFNPANAPGLY